MFKSKYLPVDGQVTKGDLYYWKDDPEGGIHERQSNLSSPNLQKVKLFLISDDIQVGDTVYCEAIEEANRAVPEAALNPYKKIKDDLELKLMRLIKCPKVIGEIINSEGIKEGQTFTEDQIYFEGCFQGFIPDNLNDFKEAKITII